MGTSPVINALRRKRAELAGQIRELDAHIHDLRREQGHIDATLKMFDPDAQPRLIKPVRPWRPQNRIFERKEVRIRVTNMLREAEGVPMTTERGTFAATFLLACLAALELEGMRLEDLS